MGIVSRAGDAASSTGAAAAGDAARTSVNANAAQIILTRNPPDTSIATSRARCDGRTALPALSVACATDEGDKKALDCRFRVPCAAAVPDIYNRRSCARDAADPTRKHCAILDHGRISPPVL